MFTKPLTRSSANQILPYSNWQELSPWSFTHVFKKIETTMRWNCMSKALRFLQIMPINIKIFLFYRISNNKNFIPKYLFFYLFLFFILYFFFISFFISFYYYFFNISLLTNISITLSYSSVLTSWISRQLLEERAPLNDFVN